MKNNKLGIVLNTLIPFANGWIVGTGVSLLLHHHMFEGIGIIICGVLISINRWVNKHHMFP